MEDGSGQREDVGATNRASVAGAARHSVVLAIYATPGTEGDSTGPALLHHVFETGAIVGKLGLELFGGVLLLGRDGLTAVHRVYPCCEVLRWMRNLHRKSWKS